MSEPSSSSFDVESLTPLRFSLGLVLILLALYPDVFLGTGTFIFRDYGIISYPVAFHLKSSLLNGEWPLWNPYNFCGIPFFAQWLTLALYPPVVFILFFPLTWALGVFDLGHLIWGGLGMYFLAYRWTSHRLAAVIAGVGFVFNGQIISSLVWPFYMVSLAWMPWVVFLVERAWIQGGKAVFWAVVAGGAQMLAGPPESILATWSLLFALWAGYLIQGKVNRWNLTLRSGGIVLMISLIAAAQILPFLEFVANSQRDADFASSKWAVPFYGLANFLVPLFYTFQSKAGIFVQPEQQAIMSYYHGVGLTALAAASLALIQRKRVLLLVLFGALCLTFSLGDAGPLYPAAKKAFPFLGLMRYPVKYLLPLTVVIPVLAAFVIQTYCAAPARRARMGRALVLIGLGFLAAIAFIVWFAQAYSNHGAPWKAVLINGAWRALFLAFILAGVMALPRLKSPPMRLGFAIGLAVLMIADFMTHNHRLNPRVKSDIYSLKLPPLEEMDPRPKPAESRAMLRYKAYQEINSSMIPDLYNNFLIYRMGLAYNCNLLDKIPKTDGFFPLEIKYYSRLLRRMNNQETLPKGLMAFMGVCQMTTEENVYEFQTADHPQPFALIGAEPVLMNDAEAMNAVLDPAFDPGETVYLPETAALLSADAGSSGGNVAIRDFQSNKIVLFAVSESPAIVSIAQAYYPAWTAKIDGEPATLWRANYAFQAVEIPAGRHEIILEYDDTVFLAGCVLSGLGLAGLCVMGVRQFGTKHRA